MKRVTAWVCRFVNNCRAHKQGRTKIISSPFLTVPELVAAQNYWIRTAQLDHFTQEIESIKKDGAIPNSSRLLPYHPFLDSDGILRVGGREHNSDRSFSNQHPIILHGTHPVTKLLIHLEHLRLLHAGPTLLASSLSTRFHIIGGRKIIRSITRGCIICRRDSAKPRPQMLGQLPVERITPSPVFNKVGVDYAGPINVKHGYVRKPTVVKAYICVFVCLSTKAVHLELVSDLTTDAFMGTLRNAEASHLSFGVTMAPILLERQGNSGNWHSFCQNRRHKVTSLISVLHNASLGALSLSALPILVVCGRRQ